MIDKIQTIGLTAKGIVYCIIGVLTALTAFDMGGSKTGKSGVIDFLQKQPFGKFILIALAIGILAYALWRLYTAFADPKTKGDDASGIGKRIGYGIYGLIYLAFAVAIFTTVSGSSGGSSGGKQHYASMLMDKSYGPWLIALIGIIVICIGIYEFYKGFSGKYLEEIHITSGHRDIIKKSGKFGYMARGVVLVLIGYLATRAGITENADMIKGTQGAFSFMQQLQFGWLVMGIVAIGLIGYGFFMVLKARYTTVTA